MTITKATVLVTAAVLLASYGTLSAAEAPQHSKARQHQHRRQAAKEVSTPTKRADQYGNNTQDNSYGGVYGENSFKGE